MWVWGHFRFVVFSENPGPVVWRLTLILGRFARVTPANLAPFPPPLLPLAFRHAHCAALWSSHGWMLGLGYPRLGYSGVFFPVFFFSLVFCFGSIYQYILTPGGSSPAVSSLVTSPSRTVFIFVSILHPLHFFSSLS